MIGGTYMLFDNLQCIIRGRLLSQSIEVLAQRLFTGMFEASLQIASKDMQLKVASKLPTLQCIGISVVGFSMQI